MTTGRFAASDGVDLFWRSWTPDAQPKAAVLLVHGVGEHGGRYGPLAEELVARGFECYAFDHRGHGESGGRRAHVDRWARYLADVTEFVDGVVLPAKHAATKLVLYGHSMGSLVLLNLALTGYTRRLSGCIGLVISGASIRPTGLAKPALVAIARLLSGILPKFSVNLGIQAEALSHEVAVVSSYKDDPLVGRGATVRWGTEALAAIESIKRRASEIDDPMLIVHGGKDPLAEAEGSRWLAEVVSGDAQLLIYEGALHEPHNDPGYADVGADMGEWIDRRLAEADSHMTSHEKVEGE